MQITGQTQHEVTYAVPSTSRGTSSTIVIHPHMPVYVDSSDDDDDSDILRSVYVTSNVSKDIGFGNVMSCDCHVS